MDEIKEKSLTKEILGWVVYIVIVIILTYLVITFVGVRTKVEGRSMENTLHDGDNLIVDKISYRFRDPKRYEIIVFPYKYQEDVYYIKRIIGLPGETVQVIDGYVYIDGEKLDEDYGKEVMETSGIAQEPIKLGEDEYFVLGDNRRVSKDSRDSEVGPVKKENIAGHVVLRIWPLSKFGTP